MLPSSSPSPELVPVRRALLSLSDKSGIEDLAAALEKHGIELISTGGPRAGCASLGTASAMSLT